MFYKYTFTILLLLLNLTLVKGNVIVLNGLTHSYKVEHGMTYKGVIKMQNTADRNQNVKIYLNDYAYNASGEIFYKGSGTANRSNALWVALNTDYLTLKPKEKYDLHFEITIPDTTENKGAFWSVLMIEPVDDIKPNDAVKGDIKMRTKVRYAIQLITTINENTSLAALEFKDVALLYENGARFLQIDILNKGELYHKVTASAELFDNNEGTEIGLFKSNLLSLLPNTSKRFLIDLSSVAEGDYSIVLLADGEGDHIFGLNIELLIKDE